MGKKKKKKITPQVNKSTQKERGREARDRPQKK